MPIHTLIADDEPAARHRLRRLARQEPDLDIIAECADGATAVEQIRALQPELAIVDVHMPRLDGLAVAEAAHALESPPLFIFVTAFAEHAMKAFRVAALDYLLKPVEPEQFARAIQRARTTLAQQSSAAMGDKLSALLAELGRDGGAAGAVRAAAAGATGGFLERIPVRHDDRVTYVRSRDVDYFEATGNYVRLHVGKQVLQVRQTMAALEHELDPDQFVRIHRQTIVNLDRVREVQPWFAGDFIVLLQDGTDLRISRTYREKFDAAMSRGRR
ncbi:MAG: response regulator transcription factor [Gemmatimonadaceae bacterium]|nr:response regulator transcription factor [Gemmatimonadaceae bacterium]